MNKSVKFNQNNELDKKLLNWLESKQKEFSDFAFASYVKQLIQKDMESKEINDLKKEIEMIKEELIKIRQK